MGKLSFFEIYQFSSKKESPGSGGEVLRRMRKSPKLQIFNNMNMNCFTSRSMSRLYNYVELDVYLDILQLKLCAAS